MDRRSWLWRRKSAEKSPGETESSGSASSHSERYSDEHEALRASPNSASPNYVQSPEVSSKIDDSEVQETVKNLTERLSAALLDISAKEDLVNQHAKVAEEAVSGWEKAEIEVVGLKQQLEGASQKNSALEDRIGHLDGALKECVRELRQCREEQEQKIHDAIRKKTHEWEAEKSELENQLNGLSKQLEAASTIDHDLKSKLETSQRENSTLKLELLAQAKDLQMQILERDLSVQAAETASKQHLESIKKVAKLEAECRQLRSRGRKASSTSDHKISNSVCLESVTDSQSDSGEQLLSLDNEANCSDLWATALITELDQFKNEKAYPRNLGASIEIELMDDFLEMERLVALPESENGSLRPPVEADANGPSKAEINTMHQKISELEAKVAKMESEKTELEVAFVDTQKQLEVSSNKLIAAEAKLAELQKQLDVADKSKQLAMLELVDVEEKREALESQLESAKSEVGRLSEKVTLLEVSVDNEKASSAEFKVELEAVEANRKVLESDLQSAHYEAGKLCEKVSFLEVEVEKEKELAAGYASNIGVLETEKKALESQLESVQLELRKLQDKMSLFEREVKQERVLSAELAGKAEISEVGRKTLESKLELANLEVGKLHDKIGLLEREVEEEKASSEAFATQCKNLEEELARRNREIELRRVVNSNGELKLKQEGELALAAERFAECQKTIASLNRHVQLLTAFDDLMLEGELPELDGELPGNKAKNIEELHGCNSPADADGSTVPNGKNAAPMPYSTSSPSSSYHESAKYSS